MKYYLVCDGQNTTTLSGREVKKFEAHFDGYELDKREIPRHAHRMVVRAAVDNPEALLRAIKHVETRY